MKVGQITSVPVAHAFELDDPKSLPKELLPLKVNPDDGVIIHTIFGTVLQEEPELVILTEPIDEFVKQTGVFTHVIGVSVDKAKSATGGVET